MELKTLVTGLLVRIYDWALGYSASNLPLSTLQQPQPALTEAPCAIAPHSAGL